VVRKPEDGAISNARDGSEELIHFLMAEIIGIKLDLAWSWTLKRSSGPFWRFCRHFWPANSTK
jgi:hypothetical protein